MHRTSPRASSRSSTRLVTVLGVATCAAALVGADAAAKPGKLEFSAKSLVAPAAPAKTPTLTPADAKRLIIDGTPGDWKFITTDTGALTSGKRLKLGSDYSGHCLTYKSQDAGINLGHVSDCSKTTGGDNISFDKAVGDTSGAALKFGDTVGMAVTTNNGRKYVCYGQRDNGINLNWGANDAECKARSQSNGNGAIQWKLMPVAGSPKKVGDPITLDDRVSLHNIVIDKPVVKCARIYKLTVPPTWYAGDLKWRQDCMHHELIWTHKELLRSLGEDPKALALSFVPAQYRAVLEKVF